MSTAAASSSSTARAPAGAAQARAAATIRFPAAVFTATWEAIIAAHPDTSLDDLVKQYFALALPHPAGPSTFFPYETYMQLPVNGVMQTARAAQRLPVSIIGAKLRLSGAVKPMTEADAAIATEERLRAGRKAEYATVTANKFLPTLFIAEKTCAENAAYVAAFALLDRIHEVLAKHALAVNRIVTKAGTACLDPTAGHSPVVLKNIGIGETVAPARPDDVKLGRSLRITLRFANNLLTIRTGDFRRARELAAAAPKTAKAPAEITIPKLMHRYPGADGAMVAEEVSDTNCWKLFPAGLCITVETSLALVTSAAGGITLSRAPSLLYVMADPAPTRRNTVAAEDAALYGMDGLDGDADAGAGADASADAGASTSAGNDAGGDAGADAGGDAGADIEAVTDGLGELGLD